jgi:DNA-binding CsgD family transcriptional regulator/PAS domain-containing protein
MPSRPLVRFDESEGERLSSDLYERAWPLLGLLYAAPGDSRAASRFVEALCKAVSDGACALGVGRAREGRPGPLVAFRERERRVADVPLALPITGKPGELATLETGAVFDLAGDPDFAAGPLFQKLLQPLGAQPGPGLGMVLERVAARVTLLLLLLPERRGWRPTAQDRALLECLAPHIRESLRLHERVTSVRADARALVTAFDHLALGVVLMDASGRVSFANRSADEILGVAAGTGAPRRAAERTRGLAQLLVDRKRVRRGSLVMRHPVDGRPLQVFVTPVHWPASYGESGARYATAVFIGDAKRLSGDPFDVLRELYLLTPGEARLALLLTTGRSVEESAHELGIALSTARGVLKGVFAKTDTRRQSDLVRLLLTGPGELRPQEAAPKPRRAGKRGRKR